MTDDVKMPNMDAAMLTALTPSLQPTGEHKVLPDGYCPDCCGAPCIKTWLPRLCDHPCSARVLDSGGWSCSSCEQFCEAPCAACGGPA